MTLEEIKAEAVKKLSDLYLEEMSGIEDEEGNPVDFDTILADVIEPFLKEAHAAGEAVGREKAVDYIKNHATTIDIDYGNINHEKIPVIRKDLLEAARNTP